MTDYEKQVEELVDKLGCSIFEAEQILADDKKINKGEKTEFDLSPEEEKRALKYANVRTYNKAKNPKKKEPKPDPTKEGTIQRLADFLTECGYEEVTIANKTKLITFKIGEESFKIDLIRQRASKKK